MAARKTHAIAAAVLDRHGRTYAEDLGIDLTRNTPSGLFRWLVASLLFSARISAENALSASKALFEAGWRTVPAMRESTWEERTRVLNRSGYARYDEKTSAQLGAAADVLHERWRGDLRRLRAEAGGDPQRIVALLKEVKGIGDVGAGIFCREAQTAWDELYPFVDRRTLKAAERLGLPTDAAGLSKLVGKADFARFVTALVRTDLAKDYERVEAATRG